MIDKILEMKFGSHLYGTSTPESDLDFKGVYLPTARQIILGNYPKTINTQRPKKHGERNTKDDVDVELVSLDRFLELLCDGQTMALDILFGFNWSDCTPEGVRIMSNIFTNRVEFLNSNVNAFVGYARQQAAKYGVKGSRMDALKSTLDLLEGFPEHDKLIEYAFALDELVALSEGLVNLEKTPLIEIIQVKAPNNRVEPHLHVAGRKIPFHATVKYAKQILSKIYKNYGDRAHKAQLAGGKDYKALSHAVRVNSEAMELLQTGKITFPRPDADLQVKIKTLQVPYEQISEMIEQGLADLVGAQENSVLRPAPNREFAAQIVYEEYKKIVQQDT